MNKIELIRHSLSHIMANAVQELFPGTRFAIGPVIENGFYYDFDLPPAAKDEPILRLEDLPKIEKRMREIIAQNIEFKKSLKTKADAKKIFADQPYKLELIKELKTTKVTIYKSGKFTDLCAGPHVKLTKEINPDAFKLTKIAGAYWRGSEKNKMLQRIYGVAFETKKELDNYLNLIEEAEKRDHRKIGKELDLFSIHEEFGPGLVYWHPKGGRMRVVMEDFWRKTHYANGYEIIFTPHIGKSDLWKISGHLGFYNENMYSSMEIDKNEYYIKPMNCPFHILIYKNKTRSYRDLPLRWAELGTVYRYEKTGVLHGLLRVRGFTQDDAHLICTPEQMPDEIEKVLNFSLYILRSFGFNDFHVYLATKPKDPIGDKKKWDDAKKALENAIKKSKLSYDVDEGGGAFYGPKIDIKIKDALGREWQCTTIQFDFNMPERFKMEYVGIDGKPHQPYMIHRALMGSLERFFGTVIEHYAGAFPFWLSPIQIRILTVGEKHIKFAQQTKNKFTENGFRVEVDDSDDTIGKKIREAEMQKIPYIIVVGDKEMNSNNLAIRTRGKKDIEEIDIDKFIEKIKQELIP